MAGTRLRPQPGPSLVYRLLCDADSLTYTFLSCPDGCRIKLVLLLLQELSELQVLHQGLGAIQCSPVSQQQ